MELREAGRFEKLRAAGELEKFLAGFAKLPGCAELREVRSRAFGKDLCIIGIFKLSGFTEFSVGSRLFTSE